MIKTASTILIALLPFSAFAQETGDSPFGIEAGVSTLGLFIAPDYGINDKLRLRAPLYFGSYSDTVESDGNSIDGSLDFASASILADYYVGGRGFRVSGGLAFGGYEFSGTVQNPTLDGTTYNGSFGTTFKQDTNVAPVLAVGYQRTFGSNWGISAELGARITSTTLTTTGQETLSATDRASFDQDIREVNDDLNSVNAIPYISVGVSFRF